MSKPLVIALLICSGCRTDGGASEAGGESSTADTGESGASTTRASADDGTTTTAGPDPDSDSTGSGGSTTGDSCTPDSPIDASAFVPGEILVDRGDATADALGDLNGDGLGDFVVDQMVVFGREDTAPIVVADVIAGLGGISFGIGIGHFVANAGDVNDDGIVDILVGNPNADFAGPNSSRTQVIFGKIDATPWALDELNAGLAGPVIDGLGGGMGRGLDGVGDLDGDGFDDFVVSEPALDDFAGRLYGVFGSDTVGVYGAVDVGAALEGWQVDGTVGGAWLGNTVKGLGDLNGDGTPDFAVSVRQPQDRVLVVFGHAGVPDLDDVASGVNGYAVSTELGDSFPLDAGDVNGDGLMDLVLGTGNGVRLAYGKADTNEVLQADLDRGIGGAGIHGDGSEEIGGVAGFAGDLNGDGFGDLVLGNPSHDDSAGRVYVVFGACAQPPVTLADILEGVGGFVVDGEAGEGLGTRVAAVGDVNGDGYDDVWLSGVAQGRIMLGGPTR